MHGLTPSQAPRVFPTSHRITPPPHPCSFPSHPLEIAEPLPHSLLVIPFLSSQLHPPLLPPVPPSSSSLIPYLHASLLRPSNRSPPPRPYISSYHTTSLPSLIHPPLLVAHRQPSSLHPTSPPTVPPPLCRHTSFSSARLHSDCTW